MKIVTWLVPWVATDEERERLSFEEEAQREIAPGHPLFGKQLRAIARRQDCDDHLFEIAGTPQVAVVHLTWKQSGKESPPYPSTKIFESLELFSKTSMEQDFFDWSEAKLIVIDNFLVSAKADPAKADLKTGTWFVTHSNLNWSSELPEVGAAVEIRTPSGESIKANVAGFDMRNYGNRVIGVQFSDEGIRDLPRLSEIYFGDTA